MAGVEYVRWQIKRNRIIAGKKCISAIFVSCLSAKFEAVVVKPETQGAVVVLRRKLDRATFSIEQGRAASLNFENLSLHPYSHLQGKNQERALGYETHGGCDSRDCPPTRSQIGAGIFPQ